MDNTDHIVKLFLLIVLLSIFPKENVFAQLSVSKTDESCCGKKDGTATATVRGGKPQYKFHWSNGQTTPTATGLSKSNGKYTITICDENDCIASEDVYIDCNEECDDKCKNCPPPDDFFIWFFTGGDPNDISGPAGYGTNRWVSGNDVLPYTIRFENDPKIATAAANKVVIVHPIDKNADMFSFRLGDIGFRNFTVPVPANTSYFYKHLNLTDSIGIILDITAGLDVVKRQAFWIFQAFDPKTGLPNLNPFLGFLAINDSITHNGEGKVRFSIKPKQTANTGDTIKAFASIVFDVNDPIPTNVVINTIDAHPPFSVIKSIVSDGSDNLVVSWSGKDDLGGCGVLNYSLFVSKNEQPFEVMYSGIVDSSLLISAEPGNRYKFLSIASDNVQNTEKLKQNGDSIIDYVPKEFFVSPNQSSVYCNENEIEVKWKVCDVKYINLELSADSGKIFTLIANSLYVSDSIYLWNIPKNLDGGKHYLIRAVNSMNNISIDTSDFFMIKNNIIVDAGVDKYFCEGDSVSLGGSPVVKNGVGPYSFYWSSSKMLNNRFVSNPYAYNEGEYVVSVKDNIGCYKSDTVYITLRNLPDVEFDGLLSEYCLNSQSDTIVCTPEGGLLSGSGMQGNIFSPHDAGVGSHNVDYKYIDVYGCSNIKTQIIEVKDKPKLSIVGLENYYCKNADYINLQGIPSGGEFFGPGIIGNIFIPSYVGVGKHKIEYTYSDQNGCANTIADTVSIIDLPLITIKDLNPVLCINSDTISLTAEPVGGTFSGSDAVVNDKFIPSIAGIGTHQIIYSYTDIHNCTNSDTKIVEVIGLPNLTISGLDTTYCLSASPVTLTGTPANGVFSGNGISGNSFNPSLAGVGSHSITYTYTDPNGCSNSKVDTVKVNGTPNVFFTGLNPSYCLNSGAASLVGSPIGGTFTGNGILGNSFNPSAAGVGTHQLTYTFTDQNTCLGKQSQSVVVNSLPSVNFSGLDSSYCVNKGDVSLTGSPSGGIFSGNGITGSAFNTSIAGIGTHIVSYSYTDNIGCSNDTSKSVKVNPLPSIYLGRDTSITTVEAITLDAGSGYTYYSWSDGSTGQTLTLDGAILGKGTHKVWVEVSDDNSCTAADTIQVEVTDNVGIDMFSSKVKLQVYPNPSYGLFNLEIENSSSENIYVEIRNNAGQLVYSKKFKGRYEDIKTEINLGGFAKGVYYINVKVKRERVTRKIVII